MKKVNEVPLTNDMFRELIHLSSDFCLIFDSGFTLLEVICEDSRLHDLISNPFCAFYPADEFWKYLQSVFNAESVEEDTFHIFLEDKPAFVQFKGKMMNDNLLVTGHLQSALLSRRNDLVDKLPIPSMLIDEQGFIVKTNEALEQLHRHLFKEEEVNQAIHSEQFAHPVYKEYEAIFNDVNFKNSDVVKDYRSNDISLIMKGIPDGKYTVIMVKDESFRERFQQLLSYQEQMKAVSQVAAGVAHELRNPLSVIKGFIQLSRLSDSLDKYYDTISSEIERMNKIIEDFLSISRKKADKKYILPSEFADSMLMIFQSECTLHDVVFSYNVQETTHFLYVNEQMIKQVLINVMRNAIEAYEDNDYERTLHLSAFTHRESYVLKMTDSGPGITPEILKRINEPFFTTKQQGTGIGIPLGKQIIEEHEGEFLISSTEGAGTTVTISLPLYQQTSG